jgi:hypothetical protein
MLSLHFPGLDHVAELGYAVIDEVLLELIPVTDNLPEIIGSTLLKHGVFCEFAEFANNLELFKADLI